MSIINLIFFLLILVPITVALRKDYFKGLCLATAVMITVTSHLLIELPGSMPNITIQRAILVVLLIFWLYRVERTTPLKKIPFFNPLILLSLTTLISLFISVDFIFSLKTYLSYTVETILFYIIIYTSIESRDDFLLMLKYIAAGLTIVGIIAIIERQTGFNPIDQYLQGYVRPFKYRFDVMSTYNHRILLGTAMAMAWPILVVFLNKEKPYSLKYFYYWASLLIIITSCYFAFSRGPWIASIMAASIMVVYGTKAMRTKLISIALLFFLVLLFKPGVTDTLSSSVRDTLNISSFKGGSYMYRWELWDIAYTEIKKSFGRYLFGFGPGSSETMTFQTVLSYSDRSYEVWSWDNQYACNLLETGMIGFLVSVYLYLQVFRKMITNIRTCDVYFKAFATALLACVTALLFMMSNVKIFAPQLNFLFWIYVSASFAAARSSDNNKSQTAQATLSPVRI